jgi:hypothetical protein
MVKTWPLLYKAWKESDDVVNKDVARLLCTMGNLFNACFDEDGNCISHYYIEVLSAFHDCFLDALIYHDDLHIDDDRNLVFNGWEVDYPWIVNPSTFKLPDEIPGY